jgi:processive 1,2-diacylglycerol beta-glucosyltransferase
VTRVLILTATVGEGHDLPARELAAALRARGAEVAIEDGLAAVGGPMRKAAEGAQRLLSYRGRLLLDLQYLLFGRFAPGRRFARWITHRMGRDGLAALVERRAPDIVVSTYPGVNEPLARMRLRGELAAPLISAITDLSSLYFWAAPGIDAHLIAHPESEAEVRRLAPGSEVVAVRGLTRAQFNDPPARRTMRPTIVVSGGGWGVGDVAGAVDVALGVDGADVVVLCGRNDALKALVEQRFGADPRVRILGFTDDMPQVLADGDCLIHSSAGLTVLEALICGCRPISYGWGVAHIRLNNRAYVRFGLADVVKNRAELRAAIDRALADPREPARELTELPDAADQVLRWARPTRGTSAPGPARTAAPPRPAP